MILYLPPHFFTVSFSLITRAGGGVGFGGGVGLGGGVGGDVGLVGAIKSFLEIKYFSQSQNPAFLILLYTGPQNMEWN